MSDYAHAHGLVHPDYKQLILYHFHGLTEECCNVRCYVGSHKDLKNMLARTPRGE